MLSYSVRTIAQLAFVCLTFICGFACALRILSVQELYNSADNAGDFSDDTWMRQMETLYEACFGSIDDDVGPSSVQFSPFMVLYAMKAFGSTEGIVSVLKFFFLGFFIFFAGIILMNLFIPILADAYDRIKLNEEAELIRRRAVITGDVVSSVSYRSVSSRKQHRLALPDASTASAAFFLMESACSRGRAILRLMSAIASYVRSWLYISKIRHRVSGKYFHYLVPVEKTGREKSGLWEGRIREIEKTLKRELKKDTEDAAQGTKASVDRCSELIEVLADRVKQTESNDAAMKDQMQTMQETLSRILQRIDQGQA